MTIRSHYTWQGEIRCDPGFLFLVKTTADRAEVAVSAIRNSHPYDPPEIIVLPVVGGLAEYLDWINAETRVDQNHPSIPNAGG
jgi:periplasmic divalent cation tolerance protein